MSHATERDWRNGPKPRNVELTREDLPQLPARLKADYCKRLKGAHVYELANVKTYKHLSRPSGYPGPLYVRGWTDYKEYRCTGCQKKRVERIETNLDVPVREQVTR